MAKFISARKKRDVCGKAVGQVRAVWSGNETSDKADISFLMSVTLTHCPSLSWRSATDTHSASIQNFKDAIKWRPQLPGKLFDKWGQKRISYGNVPYKTAVIKKLYGSCIIFKASKLIVVYLCWKGVQYCISMESRDFQEPHYKKGRSKSMRQRPSSSSKNTRSHVSHNATQYHSLDPPCLVTSHVFQTPPHVTVCP